MYEQNPPIPPQSAPIGNGPVVFDRATAQRTQAAVKYVETLYKGRPRLGEPPRNFQIPNLLVQLTSSISAATVSSGVLTYYSGTANTVDDSGTSITANSGTITVYSLIDKIAASGAFGIAAWADGKWWLTVIFSCSNLS